MLTIKNLTKQFGDRKILNNVDLNVQQGEIAILLGASGVGKSTILRILNNLETPDSGTFKLDGKKLDLTTINQTHTAGMVFQNFNLFNHLTVERNITIVLEKILGTTPESARTTAHNLLREYGLGELANHLPSQLSGGQKQRLALARTLALKPRIICMDEPTSALDPLLTTHVANTISQLAADGYIVLIATHDTVLLDKLSCSVYLMDNGAIVESTTSEKLNQSPDSYPRITQFVAGTTV